MPNTPVQAAAEGLPQISRRKALGLLAAVSLPPTAAVAVAAAQPAAVSVDNFLARASLSEKAWYHANALAEIMGEKHPENTFRSHIDHDGYFVLIVGTPRKGWGGGR